MKGVIFNHLEKLVEQEFGLEAWDIVLTEAGVDGIYLSSETYPDEQLFSLVVALHNFSGIPVNDLVRSFGKFMFPLFIRDNPSFLKQGDTLKEFLLTVDRVIHVEVRKLHPEAVLPKFEYEEENDNQLTMFYSSKRKLCYLAEGLIEGAAEHLNTQYTLDHRVCMHDGADSCELHLTISDA